MPPKTDETSLSQNPANWVKSIKIGYNDSRGYYISELVPNPDIVQPTIYELGQLIHEFNCLINNGVTVEVYEQMMKERYGG